MTASRRATVVVIHGAWADGSSWELVLRKLLREGLNVVAAPIPLTSLGDDAACLKRTMARTKGPVIVAGHAYAGAIVGTANDARIKALVYVAALAPDEGETVAQVFYGMTPTRTSQSSRRMKTVLSGCRNRASIAPSHRTRPLNRSLCAKRCRGRFPSAAFRSRRLRRHGKQSQPGTCLQSRTA